MSEFRHYVSGFFADRARLVEPPQSKSVLKDVLVDGAIGTAVGTGGGALAQLALVAANVSLFVASPLLAPLSMPGCAASLGGTVIGA